MTADTAGYEEFTASGPPEHEIRLYTAEQMARAVTDEREACAQLAEQDAATMPRILGGDPYAGRPASRAHSHRPPDPRQEPAVTRLACIILLAIALTACQRTPPPHIHCRPVSGHTECRPMP